MKKKVYTLTNYLYKLINVHYFLFTTTVQKHNPLKIYISAIDKGQISPAVMDEVLKKISASDRRSQLLKKIRDSKLRSN